jgi:hypothetical protein
VINNEGEQIITELILAGVKVLMVRKRDQIVYKLPDNVQLSSISEEQRKRLMEEIQSLHAATMLAAQQQVNVPFDHSNKPIAPKTEALVLNTPPQPTAAEADAIKETARKLREELEQQQQLMLQQQRYQQEMKRNTSSYESSSPPDNKSPRRYIKTGKYSKKKAQQQSSNPPGPMPPFNPQQLTALQQSLQTASGSMISANHSHPSSVPSTPTSSSFTPSQPPIGPKPLTEPAAIKPTVGKLTQPLPDSILSKRLPEEEFQHRDIKRRFLETLSKDHVSVTTPDYQTPFRSMKDVIDRLLPYHVYQYPKMDLDANKVSLELQDTAILDIFKCQSELFEKHQALTERLEKSDETLSMKILIGRQITADQRQKMMEEQVAQAAFRKEQQRIQAEQAQFAAFIGSGFDTMGMF